MKFHSAAAISQHSHYENLHLQLSEIVLCNLLESDKSLLSLYRHRYQSNKMQDDS